MAHGTGPTEGMSGSCHDTHPEHCPHDFDIFEGRSMSRIMAGIEPAGGHQTAEPQRHMIVVLTTRPPFVSTTLLLSFFLPVFQNHVLILFLFLQSFIKQNQKLHYNSSILFL